MTRQVDVPASRRVEQATRRAALRARARRRRRRGIVVLLSAGVLLAVVLGGGYYLFTNVIGGADFDGPGRGDVIVKIVAGDPTREIGEKLTGRGVVASSKAFTRAAATDDRVSSVQPGFYRMRLGMSGSAAVALLVDPSTRVGALEIKGGVQLDDTRSGDGSVTPGVLSLISKATCTDLDGRSTCVTAKDLRATMASTDPAELGVPQWALAGVRKAEPNRRLEGLLVPGRYDVEPGSAAAAVLRGLLATSVAKLESANVVAAAAGTGYTPYQVLVIASLVEKEGIAGDFGKVSRVVYNRLKIDQRLEMDSTVNYPLDLQAIRTTAGERAKTGPYNTYANKGLPPTPIGAPSDRALSAALAPESGPWTFFVRCKADGTSCFATTLAEHRANVAAAQASGAY